MLESDWLWKILNTSKLSKIFECCEELLKSVTVLLLNLLNQCRKTPYCDLKFSLVECIFSCFSGAFIVCWTPGLVILLLDVVCANCNVLTYEKFFLLLAEFNSAMNPIIYSYRDKEMSITFKQILCCQRQENVNGTAEGSDRSASSINHTVLSGAHHNSHSVVWGSTWAEIYWVEVRRDC